MERSAGDGGGGTPSELCSAAADHRGWPNPAPQRSVWAAVWPWGTRTACVNHLRQKGDISGFGAEVSTARAARRGGASLVCRCWVDWGSDLGATEFACVRKSKARLDKASAKLCSGAGCPPWRSGGGEMPACAARPTERPMVYMCVRNRKGRSGRCSPCKVQAEMWRRGVGDEARAAALGRSR